MRIAVVGAGPAGLYAAQELLASTVDVTVDVFDRVPAPYGLVRYGVAPDHQKTRRIARLLARTFEHPAVRFFGNVTFGSDIGMQDLRKCYHAVVFAVGASNSRSLGIPGEELPSVGSAADLVAWYNSHPDASTSFASHVLSSPSVAVIGAGNVALDIARMLVGGTDRLAASDIPGPVLDLLARSAVTDVHLLARRGPGQAKFTVPELRELGELPGVDVVVAPGDFHDCDVLSKRAQANVRVLRSWADRPAGTAPRRIHFSFWRRPVAVSASGLDIDQHGMLPVQAVVRAIGYLGRPLPGLPFDPATATVPNLAGQVHGQVGMYVAGWIKRGPSGVIGTNRADAAETVRTLFADAAGFPSPLAGHPSAVPALLERRGVRFVTWQGWLRLDAHEIALGRSSGRDRVSVPDLATMLDISRAGEQ